MENERKATTKDRGAAGLTAALLLTSLLASALLASQDASAGYLPHTFKGTLTINGAPPVGQAWVFGEIDGTLYGQDSNVDSTSSTDGDGYSGTEYSLKVHGDQFEDTDPKQGGMSGEDIVFWVVTGGVLSQRYVATEGADFSPGSFTSPLDLTVATAGQNWPLIAEINPSPSGPANDWVEFYNPTSNAVSMDANWNLVSDEGTTISLAGVTVPANSPSYAFNITDPNFLDDPSSSGDVLKLTYQNPAFAGGRTFVVDRVEYGNMGKARGDTLGRAKEAGASQCLPNVNNGCVWDVNVAGTNSGQGFSAGQSLIRSVPLDVDRYSDWTVGTPSPVYPSSGASPSISFTAPTAGANWQGGVSQTITWSVSDADTPVASLLLWVNYSDDGTPPWTNVVGGVGGAPGTTTSTSWLLPCPSTTTATFLGEVLDPNGNKGASTVTFTVDCDRPTVLSKAPTDDTAVAPNAAITITFSEPMDVAGTNAGFRLDGALVPVADISWSGTTVTITHPLWAGGSAHAFDILCGAVDTADPSGNQLNPCNPFYDSAPGDPWNWTVTTANTNPSITITAPVGGEVWSMNSNHNIDWTVSDAQDGAAALQVDLDHSNNGGASWNPIVTGRAGNSNPYVWTTPSTNCGTILVRGTVRDTGALTGTDNSASLTLDCTAPVVSSTVPGNTATGISVFAAVEIHFSEDMQDTVTENAVSILPAVTFDSKTWQNAGRDLILGHSAAFAADTQYTVTVACSAVDTSDPGNALSGCPLSFWFRTAAGNSPPFINLQAPAGGELWSGSTVHTITWQRNDENPATLDIDLTYRVSGGPGQAIASNLVGVTSYVWTVPCIDEAVVVVNATATDDQSAVGYDESAVFGIDCTPPTVSSATPTGTNVPLNAPAVIQFSEGIEQTTVTTSCVQFSPAVTGIGFAWTGPAGAEDTLTISHNNFAANTAYTVTLCNTIRDLSDPGLTLATYQWSFNTGTSTGNADPTVTVTGPAGGTGFDQGDTITITWSMADTEDPDSALTATVTYTSSDGSGTIASGLTGVESTTWVAPNTIDATDVVVTVTVQDTVGGQGSDSGDAFTIRVGTGGDTTPPTITIDISDTTPAVNQEITFECDCSDAGSGIQSYDWSITKDGDEVKGSTSRSFDYTFTAPGDYVVNVTVRDTAGNVAYKEIPITVTQGTSDGGGGFPWWIVAVIIAAVVAVLLILLLLMKRRKKEEAPAGFPPPPGFPSPEGIPPPEGVPPPEGIPPPTDFPPPDQGYPPPDQQWPPPQQGPPPGY